MRHPGKAKSAVAGFTLIETSISTGISVIAGGLICLILVIGITLYAKSSAINLAHEQARQAMDRLQRDIHAAVSIPVLVDANRVALDSTGPAAGVAFMLQGSPTLRVSADAAPNQTTVQVSGLGSYAPQVGQRFVIPTFQIEADISAVSGNTLTLVNNLGVPVTGTSTNNIVAYIADVVTYVVVNGEMRFYKNPSSTNYSVVSRSLLNPTPFGLPFNPIQ
jgi:hypothetical protein